MSALPRRSGLLLPLFSLRSRRDWGIGEIGDLPLIAPWFGRAGQRILQLLPINELPDHETSPYSALSGMAIDPRFISLDDVPDFAGLASLSADDRARLATLREGASVDYRAVRALKGRALRAAYGRFVEPEGAESPRAGRFAAFVARESWWLDDYALFRAVAEDQGTTAWTTWPAPLRDRHVAALVAARTQLADEIRYRQYLQWLADEQWRAARHAAHGLAFFGDLPFMVALDSADVWSRQHEFRLDASLGVPPDAFSATGQDWNLPVYRWDVMAASGFEWLRHRARRYAELYDGYRVDHLVGFFRTFYREPSGLSGFTPEHEADQRALGERLLQLFLDAGAVIVAEDLGVVPDFVRQSMATLQVPGCKVFRWERHWHTPGQPFVDPAEYPACSVATTGTHDTEPMVTWWRNATLEERRAVSTVPLVAQRLAGAADVAVMDELPAHLREALIDTVLAAQSDTVIFPVQDVFGWRDRINVPAVVDDVNWTWRLPWAIDTPPAEVEEVATTLRLAATRHGRADA